MGEKIQKTRWETILGGNWRFDNFFAEKGKNHSNWWTIKKLVENTDFDRRCKNGWEIEKG